MYLLIRIRVTVLVLTLVGGGAVCALGLQPASKGFTLFAHAMLDANGKPSVRISATIPHSNLIFLKKGANFEAEYELYIRVLSAGKKEQLETAVLSKHVVETEYEETRSKKKSSSLSHQMNLAPGDYVLHCAIRVKNTHLSFAKETSVSVPDFLATGIGISEPRLYVVPTDTSPRAIVLREADSVTIPDEQRMEDPALAEFDKQPALTFDVYLSESRESNASCQVAYRVMSSKEEQVLYGKGKFALSGAEEAFIISFNIDDWEPGDYVLDVRALADDPPRGAETSFQFTVEFNKAMLTRHFDTTLEVLGIIASKDELEPLRKAREDERVGVWNRFWQKRDPTPETELNEALREHFRRLRYVEENFTTSGPGWKTDRGKVYIKHGEPDETEIQADPYYQGQYLIWRYYDQNLTFVFYDRFGLGEYRLTNADAF